MATIEDVFNTLQELKKNYDEVIDIVRRYDDLYKSEEDKWNRGKWKEKHADLDEFADVLKKLKGDDFDIYDQAYDEYNSDFKDAMDEDTYCNELKENIRKALDSVKAALTPEEKEEIVNEVTDASLDATLAVSNDKPSEEPEVAVTEVEVSSDKPSDDSNTDVDSETEEEIEEDSSDDLEDYLKSHEKEFKNWRK